MEKKKFTLINSIVAIVILLISSFVYLSTIEPTTSFWDCGEFIASSYKLEVGHPPGNPVFNLFARFFTIFTDNMHAAIAVNAMNALCSAFTIFFLYLSIVHFARRIYENQGKTLSLGNSIAIFGAGAVGALTYCFSDTFWFSAVEGEVYAMSSLFTAVVFWAMLKWEEEADKKYANRWIILICFLMGLSVGVHLLNLLAIPSIVFIYYYKKNAKVTVKGIIIALLVSLILLAVTVFGIIPYLPKLAAFFDRIFVNGFGLKFNTGAAFFMVALFALCFFALYRLRKKDKPFWHTIILGFTTLIIGYSTFTMVIIRSSANTPTNEYQPDNPYTLVRYLGREQYGSAPLLYGETYTSPYDVKMSKYYTPLDDAYFKAENITPDYPSGTKMFFPRMWNSFDRKYAVFYDSYTGGKFRTKTYYQDGQNKKAKLPYFKDNLAFFFDYQLNYMYIRYFMWNFVGRQNDFHGQIPGDYTCGNWESGIKFIDNARLGDQSDGPDVLVNNRGKNHYYFLPLILGLLGLFFQLKHDSKNCWVTTLLFLLTGIAIVVYLNQPPYQVRERDYAYAGSFYAFCIWIGLAVVAIQSWLERQKTSTVTASLATAACLCVPILMGCENWDDHDRSDRYTARDLAYNYLMGADPNAIIITHGDNDTFPLWYIQEVENVRTDIRIVNTSLLGTDWYIDQMKRQQYDAAPLPITIERKQYLYGINDYPYVINAVKGDILASDAISVFRNPKYTLQDGKTDFIPAKTLLIPVNKENVIKYGIVAPKDYHKIVDTVTLTIEGDRFGKTDLILLDILAHYNWDRPIYSVVMNADVDLGLESWMQYEGFFYKFVPIRNENPRETQQIDEEGMYNKIMNIYRLESLKDTRIHADYQNIYTFTAVTPLRNIFFTTAESLFFKGEREKAIAVLDKCIESLPQKNFPYNLCMLRSSNEISIIKIIELYLKLGEREKAKALTEAFSNETLKMALHYRTMVRGEIISEEGYADCLSYIYYISKICKDFNEIELSQQLELLISKFYLSLSPTETPVE